jgi:hypothetical protein
MNRVPVRGLFRERYPLNGLPNARTAQDIVMEANDCEKL